MAAVAARMFGPQLMKRVLPGQISSKALSSNPEQIANIISKSSGRVKIPKGFAFKSRKKFGRKKTSIVNTLTFFQDIRYVIIIYAVLAALYFYYVIINRNVNYNDKDDVDSFIQKQKIFFIYVFVTIGVLFILNIFKGFLLRAPVVLIVLIIIICILSLVPMITLAGLIGKSNSSKNNNYDLTEYCKSVVK